MKPWELYNIIEKTSYTKVGKDIDYAVKADEEEKTVFLIFQGSTTEDDWKTNFAFPAKVYKHQENKMYCHRGYVEAWRSCNDVIMEQLFKVISEHQDYKVHIIGHSFGGAMSQLAAEDYFYRTNSKAEVTTFGSPKIFFGCGTLRYVRSCADFIQYGNYNDVVTYAVPFIGYGHMNLKRTGEKFNLFKFFNPNVYHLNYGDPSIY